MRRLCDSMDHPQHFKRTITLSIHDLPFYLFSLSLMDPQTLLALEVRILRTTSFRRAYSQPPLRGIILRLSVSRPFTFYLAYTDRSKPVVEFFVAIGKRLDLYSVLAIT